MSKIGENIQKIRKKVGKTTADFADIFDCSQRTYQGYERDERSFPHDLILKISQKYNANLDFIYTGEGNIFKGENEDNCYNLPVRGDVETSCGYGVEVYNETQTSSFSVSRKFINDMGINPASSEIIFARGDSMEPTIKQGDSLLVDTSKKEVYDGTLYCINLNGQLYAKRLQKISQNSIAVISDNLKYKIVEIDLTKETDRLEIIGEIKWIGRIAK